MLESPETHARFYRADFSEPNVRPFIGVHEGSDQFWDDLREKQGVHLPEKPGMASFFSRTPAATVAMLTRMR